MKRRISAVLALSLALSTAPLSFAEIPNSDTCANALYNLGLFKGSDNGFELENNATRGQIAVTLIRLMGKETKGELQANSHPFYDVPAWASNSIGWLYENYYINGVEWNCYGFDNMATPQQFITMLARTLGYSDQNGLDFTYDNVLNFAQTIGLIDSAAEYQTSVLSRGQMVSLAYKALTMPIKNSRRTLARKLCDERIFSEEAAVATGVLKAYDSAEFFGNIPVNLGTLVSNNSFSPTMTINLNQPADSYAVRVYCCENNGYYYELPQQPTADGKAYCSLNGMSYGGPNNAVSYLNSFTISNLKQDGTKYSVVVAKTTSLSDNFNWVGRSEKLDLN